MTNNSKPTNKSLDKNMNSPITLKTLHLFSRQEVFDYITSHLLKQGVGSFRNNGMSAYRAAYRNADGTRCAAGCLIADDEYDSSFEGRCWDVLIYRKKVPKFHAHLIVLLERVHENFPPQKWAEQFRHTADICGLKMSEEVCDE